MLKIFKLSRNLDNCWLFRCSSSNTRRYQFKIDEPIYYPKRGLSEDDIKPPHHQDRTVKLRSSLASTSSYYKILGVGRHASSQEIKAAYYNLAKKFHPDANPTPQETKSFQQISEAYHVLSDDASRQDYDQYGKVIKNQVYLNTVTLGDKAFNIERKTSKYPQIKPKAEQIPVNANKNNKQLSQKDASGYVSSKSEVEMKLKFLPSVLGSKEYIDLKAMVKCSRCNGATKMGGQVNIEFCKKCGGTGQYRTKDDNQKYNNCDVCNGKRYVHGSTCKTCDNRGYVVQSRRVEVNVPPGTASGDTIKVTNPLTNQVVKIIVDVENSKYFKRNGNNISSDKHLTISQAVLGGKFKIRGLYEELELSLGPGIESHTTHCFKGKGVIPTTGVPGDHIVTFKIRIPKNLTTKQRQLILALSRTEDPTFDGQ